MQGPRLKDKARLIVLMDRMLVQESRVIKKRNRHSEGG